jgi:sugar lactone lactonase YvrE
LAADLSAENSVPTGIALAPDGGVLVGTLTSAPYLDSAAKVVHITPGGAVTEVWTGLTAVTGVAIGPGGDLYALEMSTGNTAEPPFLRPHSGRLVRQAGKHRLEEVVTGLLYPIALDVGPDGAFYVAQPAFGAHEGSGVIVRIAHGPASPGAATPSSPVVPECPNPVTTE